MTSVTSLTASQFRLPDSQNIYELTESHQRCRALEEIIQRELPIEYLREVVAWGPIEERRFSRILRITCDDTHTETFYGNTEFLEFLLTLGTVNDAAIRGPLQNAHHWNHFKQFQVLLKTGISEEIRGEVLLTVIRWCNGKLDFFDALLQDGSISHEDRKLALGQAAFKGELKIAEKLLQLDSSLEDADYDHAQTEAGKGNHLNMESMLNLLNHYKNKTGYKILG